MSIKISKELVAKASQVVPKTKRPEPKVATSKLEDPGMTKKPEWYKPHEKYEEPEFAALPGLKSDRYLDGSGDETPDDNVENSGE